MDLILWRHAHAGDPWDDPVRDLDRPLSAKGQRQAERMARWLSRHLTETTRIVVSPARRAQQTVMPLQRAFRTVPVLAPGCSVDDLLSAARFPQQQGAVLVVGHQDTLGLVAARLLGLKDVSQPCPIRKGAVWWFRSRERTAGAQVVLQAVMGPDLVDGSGAPP